MTKQMQCHLTLPASICEVRLGGHVMVAVAVGREISDNQPVHIDIHANNNDTAMATATTLRAFLINTTPFLIINAVKNVTSSRAFQVVKI
jgi:hypothetical protein